MKYIYPICFLIFNLALAKNPAFILYDDGTWEKAGVEQIIPNHDSTGSPSSASLEIVATLKMQLGGAKPVASEDVFITTKSVREIYEDAGESQANPTIAWTVRSSFKPDSIVMSGIRKCKVAEDITDLAGSVTIDDLKPGKYYVLLRTSMGSDSGCAWSVPVVIKPGKNKIILRNENMATDILHESESINTTSFDSPVRSNPANESLDDILSRELKEDPNTDLDADLNEVENFEVAKEKIMKRYRNKEIDLKEAGNLLTQLKRKHNR